MTNEQTQKPYKFSFPDPWDDEAACDAAEAVEPEPPWEPPIGSAPKVPEESPHPEFQALNVVNGEELADMWLPPTRYCVEGLLPEGLTILGGAAKVGKSWLVLDLCIRVAGGLPFWRFPTRAGDALYLCLEDSLSRIQDRLNRITEDPPANLYFAVSAGTVADGLCQQIRSFRLCHPLLSLVVVDTFQIVRSSGTELSYAGDYAEVRILKALAEELRISLVLVHHLRKKGDRDPVNRLSGTTGLSGAADAVFILEKHERSENDARLSCTGRDIEQRELRLRFDRESCLWNCLSDSLEQPEIALPEDLEGFVHFMQARRSFRGTNTELADCFNAFAGTALTPKTLKQRMNRWRHLLEDCGVSYDSSRSNGVRTVTVSWDPPRRDAKAAADAGTPAGETCGPCVPCVPGSAL